MRDTLRSWTLLIAVGAVGTGCGSPEAARGTAADRDLHEGINWSVSEPGKRLDGVYIANDRALFFELRRGGLMQDVPLGEDPPPMIDGRLMDSDGRVLMWQIAADDFIDPTWGTVKDIYDVTPEQTITQRAAWASAELHVPLGRPFLVELAITTPPDGNQEEAHALQVMLDAFSSEQEDSSDIVETDTAGGNNYHHKIQVYAGSCCCPGCEHSATKSLYKNCASCATRVYVNRCNHGRCPYDSGMSFQCSTVWWGPRGNHYPRGDHSCTTQYDVSSSSGHNCHDDSELQGRSVKANAYQDPNDGYPCNNWSPHATSPDCAF